jgi:hypothetical protein
VGYRGHRSRLRREGQRRAKARLVYYEDEPDRRSAAKLLSKDEARRIVGELCEAARVIEKALNKGLLE